MRLQWCREFPLKIQLRLMHFVHKSAIASQSGCSNIGQITVNGVLIGSGPQTVSVKVGASDKTLATQIWVACT